MERTIWGTTSPIKPIHPLTATAEAVNKADTMMRIRLTIFTFTPSVMAECSPISSAFKALDRYIRHKNAGIMSIPNRGISLHSALPNPPSIQKVASLTAASFGAVYTM